jgi:phosphoribosylanthranilate isomerase
MTKIKLCGLSRVEDIEVVNNLLPEYIGFVFAPKSKRYISPQKAAELKKLLDKKISAVGVFVNEEIATVAEIAKFLDLIQLHGDEDENYISTLKNLTGKKIIKAFKIKTTDDLQRAKYCLADFILLDSGAGTGEIFNWQLLKNFEREYFLAGGLNVENVSDAVKLLKPFAVDVSSGIETDGLKDADKMKKFVIAVRTKFYAEKS